MLSIIIPIYNVVDMFQRCLDSLSEAEIPPSLSCPVEFVFVNDASPTWEIERQMITDFCARNVKKYGFITLVDHEFNRGLAASRNSGFKASNGEWIMWLDSDDAVIPNGIIDRYRWKEKGVYHYGSYDAVNCNGANDVLFERRILQPFNYGDHFTKNIMPVWTGIIHRDDVLQFNELYRVAEDYDMTLRLALNMPFVSHPELVVKYTWARAASLTFNSFWGNQMPTHVHESKRKCLMRVIAQDYNANADRVNNISDFRRQVIGS